MLFVGTQANFALNRDGKKFTAEKDAKTGRITIEAPDEYKDILKVYGFEPEKTTKKTSEK